MEGESQINSLSFNDEFRLQNLDFSEFDVKVLPRTDFLNYSSSFISRRCTNVFYKSSSKIEVA